MAILCLSAMSGFNPHDMAYGDQSHISLDQIPGDRNTFIPELSRVPGPGGVEYLVPRLGLLLAGWITTSLRCVVLSASVCVVRFHLFSWMFSGEIIAFKKLCSNAFFS